MRQTNDFFIPIPKARNTHCKVEIDGDDRTNRTLTSNFKYPVTSGIGVFSLKLTNTAGIVSGLYSAGKVVKFYADNNDGSTLQFWGRIDYVKDNMDAEGQTLEIEGRHRAYLLTETLVCYSATDQPTSTILKAIIDKLPSEYGFTYANVATSTDSMSVNWNYKPFWQCVNEICNYSGFDCYPDNDLDFHYFEANSILNTNDAIVEGQTFLSTKNWGTNDYYEKTRVTAIGKDKESLPIIYTAISDDEGDDIREVFVRDSTANTYEKIKNVAEAKLETYTNRAPQASVASFGLESVKPGENIWIIVPRQKIHGQYKLVEINQKFGSKVGGWRTETTIEEKSAGISSYIQSLNQQTSSVVPSDNINKMNYSYNFSFDNDLGVHSGTEITEGVLKTDVGASGTWISPVKELDSNVDSYELRVAGETLTSATYYVSSNGGNTWEKVENLKVKADFISPGKNIRVKIELSSADTQIYSMVLLHT